MKVLQSKERYVVDGRGKKVAVLLDIDAYQRMLDELEELESLRAYDAAKSSGDEAIPFDVALKEIEQHRR